MTVNVANNAAPSVTNQVDLIYGGWTSPAARDNTTIVSPCALTNDGRAGVADIQKLIDEALGISRALDDLNLDGVVNLLDVQIVISAASGAGCFVAR
ncbi:MAG: hypothetical protein WDO73_35370 [Ignavibacteriota bacterium]